MDGATPFQAFTKVICALALRDVHDGHPSVHPLLERLPLRHIADLHHARPDVPAAIGFFSAARSSPRRPGRSPPRPSSSRFRSSSSCCSSNDASVAGLTSGGRSRVSCQPDKACPQWLTSCCNKSPSAYQMARSPSTRVDLLRSRWRVRHPRRNVGVRESPRPST